ncbi:MAG: SDR family oxidoreductase [Chloroflexi bacterium]|nr:SDR family oxidoreductase [Chloroflexota bacterium]
MAGAQSAFDLTGRGIGITGGGGHLGSAMALGLARAGATVVICGRTGSTLEVVASRARELELAGRVVPETADVGRDEDLERVLDRVEHEAGQIDGFVNNAYAAVTGRLLEATRKQVEETLSGSLTDVIMATQVVAARMTRGGSGEATDERSGGEGAGTGRSIVNIGSMYGLVSPQPALYARSPLFHNPPAYGAAKAGLIQFTRYAAAHLGEQGIRVNAISPGPFPAAAVREDRAFVEELRSRVPLGRLGQPEDVVGALVFLLSDGSAYVTGHNLVVDGGWTIW